jgi:hypothetical protein
VGHVHNVEANCAVSGKEPLDLGVLEVLRRHTWDKSSRG